MKKINRKLSLLLVIVLLITTVIVCFSVSADGNDEENMKNVADSYFAEIKEGNWEKAASFLLNGKYDGCKSKGVVIKEWTEEITKKFDVSNDEAKACAEKIWEKVEFKVETEKNEVTYNVKRIDVNKATVNDGKIELPEAKEVVGNGTLKFDKVDDEWKIIEDTFENTEDN